MSYEDDQQKIGMARVGFAVLWFLIIGSLFFGSPADNRSYMIHLKEPLKVDMTSPDKAVDTIQVDRYEWTNYGATLQIEMLGRTVLIPVHNIKFIEVWDPTPTQQERR